MFVVSRFKAVARQRLGFSIRCNDQTIARVDDDEANQPGRQFAARRLHLSAGYAVNAVIVVVKDVSPFEDFVDVFAADFPLAHSSFGMGGNGHDGLPCVCIGLAFVFIPLGTPSDKNLTKKIAKTCNLCYSKGLCSLLPFQMDEPNQLFDDFGIPAFDGDLQQGEPPVPVDTAKLEALHAGKLEPIEAAEIRLLIASYRSWYDADMNLRIDEADLRAEEHV